MTGERLHLRAGPLHLLLSPCVGGSISAFDRVGSNGSVPVLRRCRHDSQDVLEAASFPLVPYVNRIRGGHFSFRGRDVPILPNMKGDISPLHGQGWLGRWQVEDATDRSALLSYRHQADEWPWSYEARQEFLLEETGLSVVLTCRNDSAEPMPCGLGQHPYFYCTSETCLDTRVTHVWTIDEHVLPVEKVPAVGRYDLRDRRVCGQDLDHGFAGWSGRARMSDPGWPFVIEMSSTSARFFQLYSPPAGGIFVAEPVSHANAALNGPEEQWAELGMRVVEPGEEMALDMRIDVRPADRSG